jgi:hypothetical protein
VTELGRKHFEAQEFPYRSGRSPDWLKMKNPDAPIPGSKARVIRHFQERMPYGLFVPDIPRGTFTAPAVFAWWNPPCEGSRDPARAPPFIRPHTRAGFSWANQPT